MNRSANPPHADMLNKVPSITLAFWIIKIMSTTVGETGADYLAVHVRIGTTVTTAVMVVLLIGALLLQLRMRRCVPWIYWSTVVLVSIVGTQITHALTYGLGVSLYVSTAALAVALAATFALWYAVEHTLSIPTIVTTRRELFYWAAVLLTFALGTAAGDLATEAFGPGFSMGTIVFAMLIAAIALAYALGANTILTFWLAYILTRPLGAPLGNLPAYALGANTILTFWLAYILTQPLGASLGDLLAQTREYGGLGLGTIYTSLAFLTVIIALVAITGFTNDERSPFTGGEE